VHARKGQRHPAEKSRELQRRLYLAAKRSGARRLHALYDRIVRPDVLWRAWVEPGWRVAGVTMPSTGGTRSFPPVSTKGPPTEDGRQWRHALHLGRQLTTPLPTSGNHRVRARRCPGQDRLPKCRGT